MEDRFMQTRAELKQEAKNLLKGHWGKAIGLNILQILPLLLGLFVVVGIVAAIFVTISQSPNGSFINDFARETGSNGDRTDFFSNIFSSLIQTLLTVGVNYTLLDWLRTKKSDFSVVRGIFSVFTKRDFLAVVVLWIVQTLFEFFWYLVFIIPGIVKTYAYSQTYYIYKDIADNGGGDDLNYLDYVTKSRQLMKGHKFEYFVLQLSFLGWDILAILTLGIGEIWLIPYKNTTYMAYYRSLAGDQFRKEPSTETNTDAYFEA